MRTQPKEIKVCMVLLFAKKPLELLGELNRIVVLLLAHLPGVEKLLYLLSWITLEHPLKLLEPLYYAVLLAHSKKWVTHRHLPSVCVSLNCLHGHEVLKFGQKWPLFHLL